MAHIAKPIPTRPRPTVAAIIERHGRYLMVEEQSRGQFVFNQPAGHVEAGETLEQAVVRETLEETGYPFIPDFIVGLYLYQNLDTGLSFQRLVYAGAVDEQLTLRLDADIVAVHWLSLEHIRHLEHERRLRSPLVLRGIEDYLAGERYDLQLCKSLLPDDEFPPAGVN
jgi:8-oxo-dGTP pyrophosphatase MutT (NUDIX family)